MSIQFDNELIKFDSWYTANRYCERDTGKDLEFLQESIDRQIKLIECANKDLRAYERGNNSDLLLGMGIRIVP